MDAEQGHGKRFEQIVIHDSGLFPKMKDAVISNTAVFDIPAEHSFDTRGVSIKSSKISSPNPTLYLADARRFYTTTTQTDFWLLVGFYTQDKNALSVVQIHMLHITPQLSQELWGSLTYDDINSLTHHIQWAKTQALDDIELVEMLQAEAKGYKDTLSQKGGLVSLNPKIDTVNSRLQCSIKAFDLFQVVRAKGLAHTIYKSSFGSLALPISLKSGRRGRG